MRKCACENCQPVVKKCSRLYKENMNPSDQSRYSDPRHWCQCGAWKYYDALGCEDCWKEQGPYIDR